MQIITDLQKYKHRSRCPIVLALGNFDGFHLGHQKLVQYVIRQAKKERGLAAVLTFRQHPHSILHPERKPMMLMSVEHKLMYLEQAGVDLCFLQSFTPAFSEMTPQSFVEGILVNKLHIREICMGYDAHFGHGREGNTRLMERLAQDKGFLFKKMKPVLCGGKPVSSSRIREHLVRGDVTDAGRCLGRPFSMLGTVIHGKGHGHELGFPTANLEVHSEILLPLGVYIASGRFVILKKKKAGISVGKVSPWFPGVMNFGKRPTYPKIETPRPVLELHLLDFKGEVYGKTMEIALHRFLRPEKKFHGEENLKAAIAEDVQTARRYYHNQAGKVLFKYS